MDIKVNEARYSEVNLQLENSKRIVAKQLWIEVIVKLAYGNDACPIIHSCINDNSLSDLHELNIQPRVYKLIVCLRMY